MGEKNYVGTPLQVFEHDYGRVVPEPAESPTWPNFPDDDPEPTSDVTADQDPDEDA